MSRPNTSPGTHNFEPLPTDPPPSYNEIMGVPPQHNVMPMPTATSMPMPTATLMTMPTAAYPGLESASAMPAPSAPALGPNTNPPPAGPIGFVIPEKPIVTSQPTTSFPQSYEHDDKMNLHASGYQHAACNDTRQRNQNDTSSHDEDCDCLTCCETTYMCCLCCNCLVHCLRCIAECAK